MSSKVRYVTKPFYVNVKVEHVHTHDIHIVIRSQVSCHSFVKGLNTSTYAHTQPHTLLPVPNGFKIVCSTHSHTHIWNGAEVRTNRSDRIRKPSAPARVCRESAFFFARCVCTAHENPTKGRSDVYKFVYIQGNNI